MSRKLVYEHYVNSFNIRNFKHLASSEATTTQPGLCPTWAETLKTDFLNKRLKSRIGQFTDKMNIENSVIFLTKESI